MAEAAKYAPINGGGGGGTLITDLKTEFHLLKTKKTFAYGFMFAFTALTIFLAFSPSSNSSGSLWFNNIFKVDYSRGDSFRSHFPSLFPYLFPNSSKQGSNLNNANSSSASIYESQNSTFTQAQLNKTSQISNNGTQNAELQDKVGVLKPNQDENSPSRKPEAVNQTAITVPKTLPQLSPASSDVKNQTRSNELGHKGEILKPNLTTVGVTESQVKANQAAIPPQKPFSGEKNATVIAGKSAVKNLTSSLAKKQSNKTNSVLSAQQKRDSLVKSLGNCDIFAGNWVRDESYPLYNPGSCSLVDEQFNCFLNGRPDNNYDKLRWKPKGCSLPRLDGSHMLELLRGKRLVFVGDSLNRNMWESLVCILRNSVKDQKKVYEASGKMHFKTEAYYSFVFEDYKFTVEFFATPFLVQEWEMKSKNGEKKETLRLDMLGESANNYKNADILIFNTGHWWTHEKTAKGKDYYQEGSHVYNELNVLEAFRRALTTWGRWIDANINPQNTLVFFRGYSASHFSGGQWNSGGACDHEIEPIKNETYLSEYPSKMKMLESVLKGMKTQVSYMNITRMTDYRKDGHPSMYRKLNLSDEERRSPLQYQDCSHWCLPGVPDTWNEILYAQILLNEYNKQHERP